MKGQDFLHGISDVDSDLIAEAETSMKTDIKKHTWKTWTSVAACILLAVLIGIGGWKTGIFRSQISKPSDDTMKEPAADHTGSDESGTYRIYTDSVNLPEKMPNDAEVDMIGCLVYKGKVYTQTESYYSKEPDYDLVDKLIGEYVGEAKGTLDEWSSQSDYATEFASTYTGPVYKVKGYSEDFRLCMYEQCGNEKWIQFLDNFDGIGLDTGADLFEKRMHITGNVESVSYLTHYDWNEGDVSNYKALTSVDGEQFEAFLNELNQSPFERIDYEKNPNFYETDIQGHLYLNLRDGTCVQMRLIAGGYVGCQGLGWVFVKMPGELFDMVLAACQ